MKILYFTRGQSPHDLRFLNALAQPGHRVAVLCLEGGKYHEWPVGIDEIEWAGGKTKATWFTYPRLLRSFKQVLAEFQPDVVHAGPIQRVAFIAAWVGRIPLVSMSWGSDLLKEANRNACWRWLTRYTLQHTTVLAADCQTVINKARDFGYHGPTQIFPWGVDLHYFRPIDMGSLREQLGWENNCVFLCNRTMEALYGVDVVARAFVLACQKEPNLRLLLFSKGSQENAIRTFLSEGGVENKVHFGGFAALADLPDIYRSADYYLSASHSDGSSVSLMEALACGIPAIVSDIPSNQEWIAPGQQGWLFKDGDVLDLSQKMIGVSKYTEYKAMAGNARTLAEKRADWEKNFGLLLNTYQQAVEIGVKRKAD